MGTFLVDGFLAGTWRLTRERVTDHAIHQVESDSPLDPVALADVEAEGLAILGFIAADAWSASVQVTTGSAR